MYDLRDFERVMQRWGGHWDTKVCSGACARRHVFFDAHENIKTPDRADEAKKCCTPHAVDAAAHGNVKHMISHQVFDRGSGAVSCEANNVKLEFLGP